MDQIEKRDNSWKNNALVIGALIGALTGVGTAYFLIKNAEKEGETLSLSSGQGLKLGLLILGTLRQVMQLDDGQPKGKKK
jgi:hypothetical protein